MYDKDGMWHCQDFYDCFQCPLPDCDKGTIPKGMTEKRGEILRIHQKVAAPSYYRNGGLESKYGGW